MKISACYIVKNEEENLAKSIESLQGCYDELIVTDTGSEDRTVEIAKEYGAVVYNFVWQDDFSVARNFTLDKAKGDWIIFLDADNYYIGQENIREFLSQIDTEHKDIDALFLPEYEDSKQGKVPDYVARIFRHRPYIRYFGVIHETLVCEKRQLKLMLAERLPLMHTGYHPNKIEAKLKRNLDLLMKDIKAHGKKDHYHYYLAVCHFGLKNYKEAIFNIKNALASPVRHYHREADYYHILLESMRQCGESATDMAEVAAEAIEKFPDMAEFYGEQGIILSSMGMLDEAFVMLNKCVAKYNHADRKKQEFAYFTADIMGIIYARLAQVALLLGKSNFARLASILALDVSKGKWGKDEKESVDSRQVVICIPIYRTELSEFEQVSLRQLNKVLGRYPRVFFSPDSLKFDFGELGEGVGVERFPDYFFRGGKNYSALMLNIDFYKRFRQYEYMLVYQTDAFVFSDRLSEFCAMGYDYIGAPVARAKPLWNFIAARVGKGGLSLRKISSAIRMLEEHQKNLEGPLATIFWQWEDIFWGYCGQQKRYDFQVAPVNIAAQFALDDTRSGFKRLQKGEQPFGCHGWWARNYLRWKPVIESCGYHLPAGKKTDKEQDWRLSNYLQSRTTVNIHYLWGLYRHREFYKMLTVLQAWLTAYPSEHPAWQLNMENIICLWRLVEEEQKNNKIFRICCQRLLASALQNALKGGVTHVLCRNLLVTMLPYLQKYDYEPMQELAGQIKADWWNFWVNSGQRRVHPVESKKKKILVLSKVTDEDWLLESFVRHTLTFATALLIDIRTATTRAKYILAQLEKEGLPIIQHEQYLSQQQVESDMDLVLNLAPYEFLLPMTASGNVYESLNRWKKDSSYAVEVGKYAPYLPFAYREKFILYRPLMRSLTFKGYAVICAGRKGKAQVNEELYIACMEKMSEQLLLNGIMPADMEISDLSAFVTYQELKYTQ